MIKSFAALALFVPLSAPLLACGSSDDGGAGGGALGGGTGGGAGGGGDAAAGTGGDGSGGGTNVPDGPAPASLPDPTGACPTFANGMVTFTVGGTQRQAKIWMDDAAAAEKDGPLVFYWYGTAGTPEQVVTAVVSANPGLGEANVARITALGGIVVAPVHVQVGTFPWLSNVPQDEALVDEVIGCAKSSIGFDTRRIHSLGFSAGGLFTATLSMERSSYIASVVTYSGGAGPTTASDPTNLFPAMLVFGGDKDQLVLNFRDQTQAYRDHLTGHFTFLCNHGNGHQIAPDIQDSATQFLLDHPFGVSPEPYAGGLPSTFPSYCSL